MHVLLKLIGAGLMLAGIVWFLQGISLLPGSSMTGQPQWAVYGLVALVLGRVLMVFARRYRA